MAQEKSNTEEEPQQETSAPKPHVGSRAEFKHSRENPPKPHVGTHIEIKESREIPNPDKGGKKNFILKK